MSVELTARMLVLGRVADDRADAEKQVARARSPPAPALERFRRIIEEQGGDPRVVDDYSRLPHGARPPSRAARAAAAIVTRLDAELVGRASVALGAGRDRVEDPVDPAVGIMVRAKPGDEVSRRRCRARTALPRSRRGSTRALALADARDHDRR